MDSSRDKKNIPKNLKRFFNRIAPGLLSLPLKKQIKKISHFLNNNEPHYYTDTLETLQAVALQFYQFKF